MLSPERYTIVVSLSSPMRISSKTFGDEAEALALLRSFAREFHGPPSRSMRAAPIAMYY
jgi:hypothetical protein